MAKAKISQEPAKGSNAKCKSSVAIPAVKKRGPGKPRIKLTPAQVKQMEGYAFDGCQNNTIATLMGFDRCLIDQRPDIKKILTKKRAERKSWLRKCQNYRVENDSSPVMAIFLGKNELGQSDKQEIAHSGTVALKEPIIQ